MGQAQNHEIHRLRAELAACHKERVEALNRATAAEIASSAERERSAALAAALEAVRMHVRDQYIHFPGHGTLTIGEYIDKQDTRAILAAIKADQRRQGAAWALNFWSSRLRNGWNPEISLPQAMDDAASAIESGEVEVGE